MVTISSLPQTCRSLKLFGLSKIKKQVTLFKDLYLQNQFICQLLHKLIWAWNIYNTAEKLSMSGVCYAITKLPSFKNSFFPFHYFAESQKCNTRSSITLFLLEDIPLIKEKKSSSDKISWSYSRADTAHVLLSHTHSAYLSNWLHNNRLCIPLLRRG